MEYRFLFGRFATVSSGYRKKKVEMCFISWVINQTVRMCNDLFLLSGSYSNVVVWKGLLHAQWRHVLQDGLKKLKSSVKIWFRNRWAVGLSELKKEMK